MLWKRVYQQNKKYVKFLKNIIFSFVIALFLSPLVACSTQTIETKVANATFAFYLESPHSERDFLCSATAFQKTLDGYFLLTAGHCVAEGGPGAVFTVSEDIFKVDTPNPPVYPITVISYRHEDTLDYAILYLRTTHQYPVIPLSKAGIPPVGTDVININFTDGIGKITSEGRISTKLLTTGGASGDCRFCKFTFMVQLFAGHGASGSSVVDKKTGKIVGIAVGGTTETLGAFVEPVSAVEGPK
jgi:hypothetical protein